LEDEVVGACGDAVPEGAPTKREGSRSCPLVLFSLLHRKGLEPGPEKSIWRNPRPVRQYFLGKGAAPSQTKPFKQRPRTGFERRVDDGSGDAVPEGAPNTKRGGQTVASFCVLRKLPTGLEPARVSALSKFSGGGFVAEIAMSCARAVSMRANRQATKSEAGGESLKVHQTKREGSRSCPLVLFSLLHRKGLEPGTPKSIWRNPRPVRQHFLGKGAAATGTESFRSRR